ncbi:sulfur carrier protein ThiS [bacterium]|nr:sulfur carrier protein ThiS [bacterium]
MRITVSGERREVKEGTTVAELLTIENVEMPDYVSVSVNEDFVLHKDFGNTVLKDGDEVEFLYYMGGGAK